MKENESQALYDVWTWKDKAYHDVEHLPTDQALQKRLHDSLQTVQQLRLPVSNRLHDVPLSSSTI